MINASHVTVEVLRHAYRDASDRVLMSSGGAPLRVGFYFSFLCAGLGLYLLKHALRDVLTIVAETRDDRMWQGLDTDFAS